MDYLLTEEQKMLKEMVSKFAQEKIGPVASDNEKNHRYPEDIIKEAGELGLMGIAYPTDYGGAGMDYVSYFLAVEEISRWCASTGVIVSAHSSLVCDPIYRFGTEEQKKKYLPDLLSGKRIGSFSLTEAGAGSDSGATKTTAKLVADKWVLNGSKLFATNGKEAEVFILIASTDPSQKTRGVTAFIVERDTPGYKIGKIEKKLGIKSSSTAEIILEDCEVPKENLLGELNKGFKVAMVTLDGGRLGIAAQALGIARACIEDSIKYAKERFQFDQPIASFQAIQWMLADMWMEYEAAWLLNWRASIMKDKGLNYSTESAVAKLKASEVAMDCARKAVQIHGGYGYTEDFNVERYYRDAKITEIYEGTSEIQRLVIARSLLK
ncbi:MAG: acyl-CoA dehydrogenase [Ignavibacteria bacterium GWB2_35_12]|nr:MAG: acyl-CoA dehydrogenase [Ignavibacteria bacterium GWA2_35_8]OGU39287.1 MAG: acyl-CoA dehydrogenase [Ignavibacteria bacterium GWB2_35_12]OGU89483.1 MAG: acyl-CoA dehydrogenase [Ignavibacteria bacterium RIFOXYA2_FULL_35_10]OGV21169.1 MAG: acyl-CoA dehydrogenase [Ignavibacteria bacterium RIFOXYC2_FULL_35_21]